MADKKITLKQVVEQVLSELEGPITVTDLAERVYAIYPTKAKDPMSSLRNCLYYDEQGVNLVYLDKSTVLPMRIAMQGVRFRVPIDRHAEKSSEIPVLFFDYFIGRRADAKNIRFVDSAGKPITFKIKSAKNIWEKNPLLRNDFVDVFDFSEWFKRIRPQRGDSLLVTVKGWENCEFMMEYEPKKKRRLEEIQRYNAEFANILFNMLEESRDENIFLDQAIPNAFARLSNPQGYPGDHWHEIVERDRRMKSNGIYLTYPEKVSLLERMMLRDDEPLPWVEDNYSNRQEDSVYRFKVSLRSKPSIWRVIEIKADQTFADLDGAIRDAFEHDRFDHMGGFWKLIPRANNQKRFREVEIGDINPLQEGTAADLHIGGIGLKPGDLMKYVYDFGDWIEHEVKLEEVLTVEAGKSYPALVERNKPKYQHCVACKAKGKKTPATWICLECSKPKQPVFLCEDCASEEHEEHYVEEMIY
jgi:hypothetical protein